MGRRPSARRQPPLRPTNAEVDAAMEVRAHQRAHERAAQADTAMEVVRARGDIYSVELAAATGWTESHASLVLKALEADGLLTSTMEPSPKSGLGRRYFRLSQAQGGTAARLAPGGPHRLTPGDDT